MARSERQPPRAALVELARRRRPFGANELADLRDLSGSAKFIVDRWGVSALHAAVLTSDVEVARLLLDYDCPVDIAATRDLGPLDGGEDEDARVPRGARPLDLLDRLRDCLSAQQQAVRLAATFLDLPARLEALETLEGLLRAHGATRESAGEERP